MQIQCPTCSRTMEVPESSAGQVVACPGCRGQMQVPVPTAAAVLELLPSDAAAPTPPADPTKKCPFCGETILKAARKCKHCKTDLPERMDAESVRGRLKLKESKLAGQTDRVSYAVGGKFRVTTIVLGSLFLACVLAMSLAVALGIGTGGDVSLFVVFTDIVGFFSFLFAVAFFIVDLTVPAFKGRTTPEKGFKAFMRGVCSKRYKFAYACLLDGDKDDLRRIRPALGAEAADRQEFAFSSLEGFKAYWHGLLHAGGAHASVSRIKRDTLSGDYALVSGKIMLARTLAPDQEKLAVRKLLRKVGGQWCVVNGEWDSPEDRALDFTDAASAAGTGSVSARK